MRQARVIYHEEAQGWWAESPEVPGWSAAGGSFDEVRALAEEGLPFFEEEELQLSHMKVGRQEFPMPATAGASSKHVIVTSTIFTAQPHFEEQHPPTAGAKNAGAANESVTAA
jgi:predicted RNase H-like HicB family nuclease